MAKPVKRGKHVPERTCIACRRKKPKWELVRIVRTPAGTIEVDPGGKKAGRGTYVCKLQACWETVLRKKRLEYMLKSEIEAVQLAELIKYSKTLPDAAEDAEASS